MYDQNAAKSWEKLFMWTLLGHMTLTTTGGLLLPDGSKLAGAHQLIAPLVDLIPNVGNYAARSIDPVFAETFIGYSLVVAAIFLLLFMAKMPSKTGKVFLKSRERWIALSGCTLGSVGVLGIVWLVPSNPVSRGRAYFIIEAATSSQLGIALGMNILLVGIPLLCAGATYAMFRSTSTVSSHS